MINSDYRYLLIRSRLLLPFSEKLGLSTKIEDGYVLIEGRYIKEVGRYSDEIGRDILSRFGHSLRIVGSKDNRTIPCINGVVMPGFVKCHGHNHESPLIGVAKDERLTDWLEHSINPFTSFLNDKNEFLLSEFGISGSYVAYIKSFLDDIYYGITSALNHQCNFSKYHVPDMVKAALDAGTKLVIAVGGQDRNYDRRILDTPEEAENRLNRYMEEFGSLRDIEIIPGPDQCFSNSGEMVKRLKRWADDRGKIMHMHSSEEPATTAWFVKEYGCTPVEFLYKSGVLDDNLILAHQVNTTQRDIELLANSKTKIVHNPLANTILGSGMPPIIEMIEHGIDIAISTDGSGSADNQNMLSAARLASQYQKAYHCDATLLKAQSLLERITVIPAKMLRLNAGSLEEGKDGDLILIDLDRPNLTPTRVDNVMENLIWASDGSEVKYVISKGVVLKDDYKFVYLDEDIIKQNVFHLSELFMEYKKDYKEPFETGVRQSKKSKR